MPPRSAMPPAGHTPSAAAKKPALQALLASRRLREGYEEDRTANTNRTSVACSPSSVSASDFWTVVGPHEPRPDARSEAAAAAQSRAWNVRARPDA